MYETNKLSVLVIIIIISIICQLNKVLLLIFYVEQSLPLKVATIHLFLCDH